MALFSTPTYTDSFPLDDLKPEECLAIAVQTAQRANWNIVYINSEGFIAATNYGTYNWNAEVRLKIEYDRVLVKSTSLGNEWVDWGKNKQNVAGFIALFQSVRPAFGEYDLEYHVESLQPFLSPVAEDMFGIRTIKKVEPTLTLFSIFKPVEGYFITPILVLLNMVLFIAMVATGVNILTPDSTSLLQWGANYKPMTLNGQWWRLITCCFLHIGILHLLMNMYALIFIGFLLEPYLGRTRFLLSYLLAGLGASIISLWWHGATISAGASGAIFGMYGVFLSLLSSHFIVKTGRRVLFISMAIFVGYNLIGGLKSGIDNAAHIGGLLSGLLTGYIFIPSLKRPDAPALRLGTLIIASIAIIGLAFFLYNFM